LINAKLLVIELEGSNGSAILHLYVITQGSISNIVEGRASTLVQSNCLYHLASEVKGPLTIFFQIFLAEPMKSRTDVKEHDKKSKVLIQKTIAQIFFI